ncbi:MAG: S-layer homology domain-containing protein [Clostridia bacterium]|nr:S-layer homology domain-containing protein [Clostridia bacterium]
MKNFNKLLLVLALCLVAVFAISAVTYAGCITHTYKAATCTTPKTCTKCGATLGSALGHNYSGGKCTRCGKTQPGGGGTTPTPEPTPTPVHTHTYTAATCTKPKTCTSCGATLGSALGHNFQVTSTQAATCTAGGKTTSTCTRCGQTQSSTTPALGHDYVSTTTAATCTSPAKVTKRCSRCGDTQTTTTGSALGHNFVVTSKVDATCTAGGKTVTTCSRCGLQQSSTTPALGHNYGSYVVTTAATCTSKGVKTSTCSRCGDKKTESIPALGHDYKTTTTSATCTKAGLKVEKCSRCGDTKTTSIPALGHDYKTTTTSATCTKAGSKVEKCSRCGDTKTTSIPALGHNYKVSSETPATCEKSGSKVEKCTRCGDTKTTTIPALGHDYKTTETTATCTEPGRTVKKCTRCGKEVVITGEPLGHDYQEYSRVEPTCEKPGKIVRKCSRCGATQEESIPALGHKYSIVFDEDDHWYECDNCGHIYGKEPHDFDEDDVCRVCGYHKGAPIVEGSIVAKIGSKTLSNGSTTKITDAEVTVTLAGSPASSFIELMYTVDGGAEKSADPTGHNVYLKLAVDDVVTIRVYGILKDGTKTNTNTYKITRVDDGEEEETTGELIVEPWMKENDELNKLAVSLRSEPYDNPEDRGNKNIYALNEKVVYYVDYKNGSKDTNKKVTLTLELPLSYKVNQRDGASYNSSKGTFTWTFANGLKKDEAGTKVVVVTYTSLGNKSTKYKQITPMAKIALDGSVKDKSGVVNIIVKDFDVEIGDEHDPYMFGDRDTGNFRPDDSISRAEGALVLTRIFGINTSYDTNLYNYPDLDETYLSARRAIKAATAAGIISGYPDGTYRPNKKMTRGEFVSIIARQVEEEYGDGFEVKDEDSLIKIYKDKSRIYYLEDKEVYDAAWTAEYATLLCRLNMAPVSEKKTNLRLSEEITRAEVAQLCNLYLLRAPAKVTKSTTTKFPDLSRNHKLFADIVEATRPSHTYSITEDGKEKEEK